MAQQPRATSRFLGRKLREIRERQGKTHADVAKSGICSKSTLNYIENGTKTTKPGTVAGLCDVYKIGPGPEREELKSLASAANQLGWYEQNNLLVPTWLRLSIEWHEIANHIMISEDITVYGLFQTRAYAEAITTATLWQADQRNMQQIVDARMEWSNRFWSQPDRADIHWVTSETVFRRIIGNSTVMDEQIEHLVTLSEQNGVTISVIPFSAGGYTGMSQRFTIMDSDDPLDPSLTYFEYGTGPNQGSMYFDRGHEVDHFRQIFGAEVTKSITLKEYLS